MQNGIDELIRSIDSDFFVSAKTSGRSWIAKLNWNESYLVNAEKLVEFLIPYKKCFPRFIFKKSFSGMSEMQLTVDGDVQFRRGIKVCI